MFLNVNIIQQCVSSYGGPGTQAVSEQWGIGWDTYLARLQKNPHHHHPHPHHHHPHLHPHHHHHLGIRQLFKDIGNELKYSQILENLNNNFAEFFIA